MKKRVQLTKNKWESLIIIINIDCIKGNHILTRKDKLQVSIPHLFALNWKRSGDFETHSK